MIHDASYDFSFSGLKTAVRNLIGTQEMTPELQMAIACEFEDAAADVLVKKTLRAVEEYGARSVLVGGGVSANVYIKEQLNKTLEEYGAKLFVPPPEFSTDNALMIALAGYFRAQKKEFADPATLRANGNWRLGSHFLK